MAVRDALVPVPLASPPAAPARPPITVPDDLVALALTESEEWAQNDTLDLAKERYRKLGDWQAVRRAFGIGELPA